MFHHYHPSSAFKINNICTPLYGLRSLPSSIARTIYKKLALSNIIITLEEGPRFAEYPFVWDIKWNIL